MGSTCSELLCDFGKKVRFDFFAWLFEDFVDCFETVVLLLPVVTRRTLFELAFDFMALSTVLADVLFDFPITLEFAADLTLPHVRLCCLTPGLALPSLYRQ